MPGRFGARSGARGAVTGRTIPVPPEAHIYWRRAIMTRKVLFRGGWFLLLFYAGFYAFQVYWIQDIPTVSPTKWGILLATIALIYFARNHDDVTAIHLPH
jgi:hypothetical protein